MVSRLATSLHPVAGRPLVWHNVWLLAQLDPAPERVVVLGGEGLIPELFSDIPVPVEVVAPGQQPSYERDGGGASGVAAMVLAGAAWTAPAMLQPLLSAPSGGWIPTADGFPIAVVVEREMLVDLLRRPAPLAAPGGALAPAAALRIPGEALIVRTRRDLAAATRRIHDRLIASLMTAGVTFLLPESVLVDVDVRVGRDTMIYPGVVLEGQTTVGEETVIGPGCRIIDSWVGSGVEMKGWNYISHTSVRNRAILEPYTRRGFD
jgi:bifunctional N-acetylglucosamine-1-phosphate-uridyltransferase/glucosamine-1-phosphate-acetyltransferase GlmU-like protein